MGWPDDMVGTVDNAQKRLPQPKPGNGILIIIERLSCMDVMPTTSSSSTRLRNANVWIRIGHRAEIVP